MDELFKENSQKICKCGKKISILSKQCKECYYKTLKGSGNPMFGTHRIGKVNPNFGNKWTKEQKEKQSIITKQNMTDEIKQYMRDNHYDMSGKNNPMFNVHRYGIDAPSWQGGLSFEGYFSFTQKLREEIRTRDNYECQICHCSHEEHLQKYNRKLSIHHIDYNKQNCEDENLITLCILCHMKTNFNRDYWYAYFNYIIEETHNGRVISSICSNN